MGDRPKILLVGPFPPVMGGVTRFMINLMESPLAREFEFVPFTTSRPPKRNVIENWGYGSVLRGGAVRVLQGIGITLWHVLKFPFVVPHVDLVQIQSSDFQVFWESSVYLLIARMFRKPVLFRLGGSFDRFHDVSPPLIRHVIRRIINVPQVLIVQSNYWREALTRIGRREPVLILPNWTEVRERSPRAEGGPVKCLFLAGSEAKLKGVDEVLDAIQRLSGEGTAIRCHMVSVADRLSEEIVRRGLQQVISTEGPVEHRVVLQRMAEADIFLLPSHSEGFPNSLLEAMSTGLPAIVTPVGAIPEIVGDESALTVPARSVETLVQAVRTLVSAPELRFRLGTKARSIVETRYTAATALPPLADMYHRLLTAPVTDRTAVSEKD